MLKCRYKYNNNDSFVVNCSANLQTKNYTNTIFFGALSCIMLLYCINITKQAPRKQAFWYRVAYGVYIKTRVIQGRIHR